jgi:hypothetical protein
MTTRKHIKSTTRAKFSPLWLLIGAGILILLAALALAVWKPARDGAAAGGGQISVDQEAIDFGQVKLGKTVTATFTLTNRGSGALKFSEAPYIELKKGC